MTQLRGKRSAAIVIDATDLTVAPGFINMLSWATDSLIQDGRALSDLKQGVTLEVIGEGWSMGPLNPAMKEEMKKEQGDIRYDITWTTLGEYLEHLQKRGVSVNVASFVGAATVRIHELGYANRAPTEQELTRMQALVREAMEPAIRMIERARAQGIAVSADMYPCPAGGTGLDACMDPGRHAVLPDVRSQREARSVPAMGQSRVGRGGARAGGCVPEK